MAYPTEIAPMQPHRFLQTNYDRNRAQRQRKAIETTAAVVDYAYCPIVWEHTRTRINSSQQNARLPSRERSFPPSQFRK